ncbi:MAG: hypothetical protein IT287_05850 [Bdellovibrionaceae bacterium]|nr:hypothetical protein [Pseudobdellovibrionaceae bacterium]
MRKILFLAVFSLGIHAFAEDDVLSILGDSKDKKDNGVVEDVVKGNNVSPLKALFPKTTAEQNIFFELLAKGENDKALLQYFEAFGKTPVVRTSNGQGLLSYLFLKNKMPVFAVENLFSQPENAKMSSVMAETLRGMLPDNSEIWRLARIQWSPQWTTVFSPSIEVQVKARKVFTTAQIEELKNVIKISAPDTKDRAAIQWQLVLALALNNDAATSAKLLQNLMASKVSPVQEDLMSMTAARMLFESGYMDAAIKYYKKVPKSSDYWLEAQEEIAWSYIRKGEPQNALAITESLVIPEFKNIVGPETVFLRSLSQLKVCDYPGVLKSLNTFRERYQPRTKEMLLVAENANTPAVKEFVQKMKQRRYKLIETGALAAKLPRLVTRDESLYQHIRIEDALEKEAAIAEKIYGQSLALGTSKIGFQGEMEALKNLIDSRVMSARNATMGRFKALAQEEVTDVKRLLQKLHIVEAEVLQQALTANKVAKATENSKAIEKKGTTVTEERDQVTYPFDSNQVWFDEVANLKVDVIKGCQAVKR